MSGYVKSFRELDVYELARTEARRVYVMTKSFPKDERYALTDQIRRSSRAVNALVAEAWARRKYRASFINKLDDALGEAMETQAWLDHALDCEYVDKQDYREHDSAWQHVGAMLNKMMQRADAFCSVPAK